MGDAISKLYTPAFNSLESFSFRRIMRVFSTARVLCSTDGTYHTHCGILAPCLGWLLLHFNFPHLPIFSSAASSRRRSSRKRKASQSCPPAPPSLARTQAEELTRDLLSLFSEMLLIGIAQDSLLQNQMAQIASNFAATSKRIVITQVKV